MLTIILVGGKGTRYAEVTKEIPKPLIKVCGQPLFERIVDIYVKNNQKDFILATGYRADDFIDYLCEQQDQLKYSDVSISTSTTFEDTPTGARILKASKYVGKEDDLFFVTYGDGIADIDMGELLETHKKNNGLITISVAKTRSNWGAVRCNESFPNIVNGFEEKPYNDFWTSIGFMVFDKKVLSYFKEDSNMEKDIFPILAREGKLRCYYHRGSFYKLDTFKDHMEMEEAIKNGVI